MAIGWFICPYLVENNPGRWPKYKRTVPFKHIVAQMNVEGGTWAGSECLGNHIVVKIRASTETLQLVNDIAGVIRLPKNLLSSALSDLTVQQKTVIVNKLRDLGYPISEIREHLGSDISDKTLGDVLRFAVRRRLTPRFDETIGEMVLDGPERPTNSIDKIDDMVVENG